MILRNCFSPLLKHRKHVKMVCGFVAFSPFVHLCSGTLEWTAIPLEVIEFYLLPSFTRKFGSAEGSGPGQLSHPRGLAVDPEAEELFVAESVNHRLSVFNLETSQFKRTFGSRGNAPGQFSLPRGLCFFNDRLLVADSGNIASNSSLLPTALTS